MSALDLVAQGYAAFPCRHDKAPACPEGFKAASTDPDATTALFRRYRAPLIGVATGAVSGFSVLDLDLGKGGDAWWAASRERLPPTRTHETRSGGLHLLFRHVPVLRNTASRVAPGVDTRGDGGYIVWWPADGYTVLNPDVLADWPTWLLQQLAPKQARKAPADLATASSAFQEASLAGLVRFISNASEGHRNDSVFWAACRAGQAVRAKVLTEEAAIGMIVRAAKDAGLPDREAEKTAASGVKTGMGSSPNA